MSKPKTTERAEFWNFGETKQDCIIYSKLRRMKIKIYFNFPSFPQLLHIAQLVKSSKEQNSRDSIRDRDEPIREVYLISSKTPIYPIQPSRIDPIPQ